MEGIHIPAMPDPQLLGRDRADPGWRESSARLTPEPGHNEGEEKEVDIPAAGITSGAMSFWFHIHHI